MQTTKPSDYPYKRYRVTKPERMHVTTVAFDPIENILLTRKAGGIKQLSAIVRNEAARIRATGDHKGTLSAEVLRSVKVLLA